MGIPVKNRNNDLHNLIIIAMSVYGFRHLFILVYSLFFSIRIPFIQGPGQHRFVDFLRSLLLFLYSHFLPLFFFGWDNLRISFSWYVLASVRVWGFLFSLLCLSLMSGYWMMDCLLCVSIRCNRWSLSITHTLHLVLCFSTLSCLFFLSTSLLANLGLSFPTGQPCSSFLLLFFIFWKSFDHC